MRIVRHLFCGLLGFIILLRCEMISSLLSRTFEVLLNGSLLLRDLLQSFCVDVTKLISIFLELSLLGVQ